MWSSESSSLAAPRSQFPTPSTEHPDPKPLDSSVCVHMRVRACVFVCVCRMCAWRGGKSGASRWGYVWFSRKRELRVNKGRSTRICSLGTHRCVLGDHTVDVSKCVLRDHTVDVSRLLCGTRTHTHTWLSRDISSPFSTHALCTTQPTPCPSSSSTPSTWPSKSSRWECAMYVCVVACGKWLVERSVQVREGGVVWGRDADTTYILLNLCGESDI